MPLADAQVAGDFYRSWQLVSIDGLCLDVADTTSTWSGSGVRRPPAVTAVAARFRRSGCWDWPNADHTRSSTPRSAPTAPASRRSPSRSCGRCCPGMLLLADRGFFSYTALGQGPRHRRRPALADQVQRRPCPSRSATPMALSRSHIYPGTKARRNHTDGIAVRVIEYTLEGDAGHTDADERTYRLLTTITDPTRPRLRTRRSSTPSAGRSRPPSASSRPTNAAPASCCAPNCPTASSKRSTATSASTTRSAG